MKKCKWILPLLTLMLLFFPVSIRAESESLVLRFPSDVTAGEISAYLTDLPIGSDLEKPASIKQAEKDKKDPITVQISKGTAEFSNLPAGIYLIMQNKACSGYEKIDPFLVQIGDDTASVMDAEPKMEKSETKVTRPSTTPRHTYSPGSRVGTRSSTSSRTALKTDTLVFLALGGLILVAVGCWLADHRSKKQK